MFARRYQVGSFKAIALDRALALHVVHEVGSNESYYLAWTIVAEMNPLENLRTAGVVFLG